MEAPIIFFDKTPGKSASVYWKLIVFYISDKFFNNYIFLF